VQHYNWYIKGDVTDLQLPLHDGLVYSEMADHLWLNTGTCFGEVPVVINVLDSEPPLAEGWDQVHATTLEVTQSLKIIGGDGEWYGNIDLVPREYLVRYYVSGYDAGMEQDVADEGHPAPDRYELELWPA
jgi:hypothetical protein